MKQVRPMAVAGQFYPAESSKLESLMQQCFSLSVKKQLSKLPRAIIAPHAGFIYSGPIAASIYQIVANNHQIKKVLLLGPSHRVSFQGIAMSGADAYVSPFGEIQIDKMLEETLAKLPMVGVLADAHAQEHCLEVQVPFLQQVLPNIPFVPLVVGQTSVDIIANVINAAWADDTLVVISSDLSHYLDYESAKAKDLDTTQKIEALTENPLMGQQACGARPINGLLKVAREKNLHVTTIDLRNSGDTYGNKQRVVGYGAYVFTMS